MPPTTTIMVTSCHAAFSVSYKEPATKAMKTMKEMKAKKATLDNDKPGASAMKAMKTMKASEAFRDECAAELDNIAAEAHENEMNAYAFAFQ